MASDSKFHAPAEQTTHKKMSCYQYHTVTASALAFVCSHRPQCLSSLTGLLETVVASLSRMIEGSVDVSQSHM